MPTHDARTRWELPVLVAAVVGVSVLASRPAWWPGFLAIAWAQAALVLLIWHRGGVSMRTVLGLAVLFRLTMLWIPPVLSDDAFRYVWDGMLQVEGINPYLFKPEANALAAFHGEPIYSELNSAGFYSIYPPVSQLIFAVGGLVYDQGWLTSFYVIKSMLVVAETAGVFVLSRMVDARSLLLYAWNPYVLIEVAGQAHTEAAMVLCLILTVWLVQRKRPRWASVVLACAGWVKLYPFVLFPLLWRRFGWRTVWPGGLAIVVLALPYADPSVPGHIAASLDLYVRYYEFNAGLYYGIKEVFRFFTGQDWSKQLGPALRWLFLVSLPVCYYLDARFRWSLTRAFVVVMGVFMVLATTVHPWYLLGILALSVLFASPAWYWHWVCLASLGTYLLYVDGPYWTFVIIGWTGWLVLLVHQHGDEALQQIQRWRAQRKFDWIRPHIPEADESPRVLDLGAGEGYVGAAIQQHLRADVVLADVVDLNRTSLEHVCYDGRTLPFDDDRFEVTVLYFVLHHAEDAERVVQEAARVSREQVIVVESVYERAWDRRLLETLDRWANRLRSGGRMRKQEAHLHVRTEDEWIDLFEQLGLDVIVVERRGRWVHRQRLFVLDV